VQVVEVEEQALGQKRLLGVLYRAGYSSGEACKCVLDHIGCKKHVLFLHDLRIDKPLCAEMQWAQDT
jgi:hypothetical protein